MTTTAQAKQPEPQKEVQVIDQVMNRVTALEQRGGFRIPANYSAPNALYSAWLILKDSFVDVQHEGNKVSRCILDVTTKPSQTNALFKMVVQGLNPNKHQCAFVKKGNRMIMMRQYQGSEMLAKRYGMKKIVAVPVYSGDEFKFNNDLETGYQKVIAHETDAASYGKDVKAAYVKVTMQDGEKYDVVMTIEQIRKAWSMGSAKGNSLAHNNFSDEMACKTVINRACKKIIDSSDDGDLFADDEDEVFNEVREEISTNANQNAIGFENEKEDYTEIIEEPAPSPEPVKQEVNGPAF